MRRVIPALIDVRRYVHVLTGVVSVVFAVSCASGGVGSGSVATEAEWRSLAAPRPAALPGAARVSLAEVQLVGSMPWDDALSVPAELGVAELVVAGLLRRADVRFVERRRFTAAVALERSGQRRAPGAPAAGVSPGSEFLATASWLAVMPGQSSVELRLADATTGSMAASARVLLGDEVTSLEVARAVVTGILEALEDVGRLPAWQDPREASGGISDGRDVSAAALTSFMRGLAAEEVWRWEDARRGYQAAADELAFFEARAALARAARLRTGGTLGEN